MISEPVGLQVKSSQVKFIKYTFAAKS